MSQHFPLFVKGDLDGFFGLAIDNLIQLLLIVALCIGLCGFPPALVFGKILPAAALSIFFGNIYYSWEAHRLYKKTGRLDICALPYGINTVSLFAFIFFVIFPVYKQTNDPNLAWKVGVLACFLSGVLEMSLSFLGKWIRQVTPRAALLSALAGIAITFISMDFAFQTFAKPVLALLPLAIIFLTYFSKVKLPFGIPGGLLAVLVGTLIGWAGGYMDVGKVLEASKTIGVYFPSLALGDLFEALKSPYVYSYLAIIVPMALFNVVGSLQNIESAEAAGDSYPTRNCLLVNGAGTILASFFGSCFPTTIYIGHPGWKALGARAGYSVLNGIFILTICFIGAVNLISNVMPMEAGIAIVLWIGIVIVAQAYQATPKSHAPAVAVGLIPAMAAWALLIIQGSLFAAGSNLSEIGVHGTIQNYSLKGILALNQGFIFISMIWAAISVFLIENQFTKAFVWSLVGGALAFFGVIHTFDLQGNNVLTQYGWAVGFKYTIGYFAGALFFLMARCFKMKEA